VRFIAAFGRGSMLESERNSLLERSFREIPAIPMTNQSAANRTVDSTKNKIKQRQARVGIIGLGYVGLPLGSAVYRTKICRHRLRHRPAQGRYSRAGWILHLPHQRGRNSGGPSAGLFRHLRLRAIEEMDAIIICVPTPLNQYHEPDLSFITDTTHAIAPHLQPGQLVVLESTTYPGTTEEVMVPILEKENKLGLKAARGVSDAQKEFFVAFSPEREDPGNTTVARRDIPKVVGGVNPQASELAGALYGSIFHRTVPVSSPAAAEMTKLLENIYRCVNIALVNELKMLCLRMGIWTSGRSSKPPPPSLSAFIPSIPVPGLGGHCIPVDPFYLSWKAKEWDFRTRFIELAGEINTNMPYHVLASIGGALNRSQEIGERSSRPDPGRGLQERHRRSARVSRSHHHRTVAKRRSPGQLSRSLLPFHRKRTQVRFADEAIGTGEARPIRLRRDRHRPLRLRS
jgi:UDP-N-acetyl-D-glucosamine dehydrogenase